MIDKDFELKMSDATQEKLESFGDLNEPNAPSFGAEPVSNPYKLETDPRDERIRQLEEQVLKLKCDADWISAESKDYREKWQRQCRLSMERLEQMRQLEAENARLQRSCAGWESDAQRETSNSDYWKSRESALREAVAGLADECKDNERLFNEMMSYWKHGTTLAIPAAAVPVGLAIGQMLASKLDAILKGGGA